MAHSASVNCLTIGKKACRLFVTGGDDHKVNVWAIGKPNSLMVRVQALLFFLYKFSKWDLRICLVWIAMAFESYLRCTLGL